MKYKLIIPTTGSGKRLGEITNYTNKSLVKVGDKPVISHILGLYPEDVEVVVTLGHFGDQVKDFLELVYSNRVFRFVEVYNYDGVGSSLVHSLLQVKGKIDCPFIVHACDTIVSGEQIREPSENWLGGAGLSDHVEQYTSFDVFGDRVIKVHQKGKDSFDYAFIGIAGVFDYKEFFSVAERMYQEDPSNSQLSNIDVHQQMIKSGVKHGYSTFPLWLDTGNKDSLREANQHYPRTIRALDKRDQAIFLVDDKVVKFFHDKDVVRKRVRRAEILGDLVPSVTGYRENFYVYNYISGSVLDSVIDERLTNLFLVWCRNNLWKEKGKESPDFWKVCYKFYFDKTKKRIEEFLDKYSMEDRPDSINGYDIPKIFDLIKRVFPYWLCSCGSCGFHGDLILDNVLYTGTRFVLLDWRQDFGGDLCMGDMYYDLAKLNGSFIFNQKIVDSNNFDVVITEDRIRVDLLMSYNLTKCRGVFSRFLRENDLDEGLVNLLTSIIWINMAPLHDHPLDMFLYYFGKLALYRELGETRCYEGQENEI